MENTVIKIWIIPRLIMPLLMELICSLITLFRISIVSIQLVPSTGM